MSKARVRVVETLAIVVPIFEHDWDYFANCAVYIPCEPLHNEGFYVMTWNFDISGYDLETLHETQKEAVNQAEKRHLELCKENRITP